MLQVGCSELLELPDVVVVLLCQGVFVLLVLLFLQYLLLDGSYGGVGYIPEVLVDVVLLFEVVATLHLPICHSGPEDDLGVFHSDLLATVALLLEVLILYDLFLLLIEGYLPVTVC